MAKALTVKGIENLNPRKERYEVPDGEVRGLYVQVFSSGARSWCLRYRFARRSRKLTLGSELTLRQARDLAREAHGALARGQDPAALKQASKIAARPAADLVGDVVAQFLDKHVSDLSPRTRSEVKRLLNKEVAGPWRTRRLSEITRGDVHALLDPIKDRAPIQASRLLAWLKGMANFAIQRGILESNPFTGIKPPAVSRSRDRVLSDSEIASLWRATDGLDFPYAALIKLLVLTGQRRGEVSGMMWSELDLAKGLWVLPARRSKNSRQHEIPLSDAAIGIIKACPRLDGSDFVLTSSGRRPIGGFDQAKQDLDRLLPPDMPSWVFHDLRRTAASGLARLRIAPHIIESVLNHKSGIVSGIAAVYNRHEYGDERREALEAWGAFVERLTNGKSTNVIPLKALADRSQ
jgi:integrase